MTLTIALVALVLAGYAIITSGRNEDAIEDNKYQFLLWASRHECRHDSEQT